MPINSRQKGARGERLFRDVLRAEGYMSARRGQQFCGSPDSPDVVCSELDFIHWEIKAVERLNIEEAMEQARRDARGKVPLVAHKRNFRPWLITMDAETFFQLLRGELPPDDGGQKSEVGGQKDEETEGTNRTDGTDDGARENTSSGLRPPSPQRGEGAAAAA